MKKISSFGSKKLFKYYLQTAILHDTISEQYPRWTVKTTTWLRHDYGMTTYQQDAYTNELRQQKNFHSTGKVQG